MAFNSFHMIFWEWVLGLSKVPVEVSVSKSLPPSSLSLSLLLRCPAHSIFHWAAKRTLILLAGLEGRQLQAGEELWLNKNGSQNRRNLTSPRPLFTGFLVCHAYCTKQWLKGLLAVNDPSISQHESSVGFYDFMWPVNGSWGSTHPQLAQLQCPASCNGSRRNVPRGTAPGGLELWNEMAILVMVGLDRGAFSESSLEKLMPCDPQRRIDCQCCRWGQNVI